MKAERTEQEDASPALAGSSPDQGDLFKKINIALPNLQDDALPQAATGAGELLLGKVKDKLREQTKE